MRVVERKLRAKSADDVPLDTQVLEFKGWISAILNEVLSEGQ